MVPSSVATGPNKNAPFPTTAPSYTLYEGPTGQLSGAINGFSIVVGSPRGAVDVNVLVVEAQAARLHRISDIPIQHSYTSNPAVISHANTTDGVVGTCRYFSSTSGAMSVGVTHVVARSGIIIILVNIPARLRVIVGYKIGVVLLDAIVKDGDDDALPGDAHLPRLLHAHVQLTTAVQVPHEGEPGILNVDQIVKHGVGVNDVQLVLWLGKTPWLRLSKLLIKALVETAPLRFRLWCCYPFLSAFHNLLFSPHNLLVFLNALVGLYMWLSAPPSDMVAGKVVEVAAWNDLALVQSAACLLGHQLSCLPSLGHFGSPPIGEALPCHHEGGPRQQSPELHHHHHGAFFTTASLMLPGVAVVDKQASQQAWIFYGKL